MIEHSLRTSAHGRLVAIALGPFLGVVVIRHPRGTPHHLSINFIFSVKKTLGIAVSPSPFIRGVICLVLVAEAFQVHKKHFARFNIPYNNRGTSLVLSRLRYYIFSRNYLKTQAHASENFDYRRKLRIAGLAQRFI